MSFNNFIPLAVPEINVEAPAEEAVPEITVEAPAEEAAPAIVVEAPAETAAPEVTVEAPTEEAVAADAAAPAEEKKAGLAGLIQFSNSVIRTYSKPLL